VASLWLFLNISWLFWLFSEANLAIFSYFNMATLGNLLLQLDHGQEEQQFLLSSDLEWEESQVIVAARMWYSKILT
jgi:hypothetical protein